VSKIENAHDMDISTGDLVNYSSAVNMRLEIGFSCTRLTMVDVDNKVLFEVYI
jgi:hypothetical protein